MPLEWRKVLDGTWEVSNTGRVRHTVIVEHLGRIASSGYRKITFNRKPVMVHRLVAEAFLGPRPPDMDVNHKDCDKTNNSVANLEYLTHGGNVQHAYYSGRKRNFPVSRAEEMIRRLADGESLKRIVKEMGCGINTVRRIARGLAWEHLSKGRFDFEGQLERQRTKHAKLVADVSERLAEGWSSRKIEQKYNIGRKTVRKIREGHLHGNYHLERRVEALKRWRMSAV